MKQTILFLLASLFIISSATSYTQTSTSLNTNGSDWKANWISTMTVLDEMFAREQAQFRLMQTYQNEATEELILRDMDSLFHFESEVNSHIQIANSFTCPNTDEGLNACETLRLKVAALREYFEQNKLQIQVNNMVLQKKLKNEKLDFKVSEISEVAVIEFKPNIK